MNMLKREWKIFKIALIFFTRLPVIYKGDIPKEYSKMSIKYLPLVGWIVGVVFYFVFFLLSHILPQTVSVIFSLLITILFTGAIHEDGFADCCDGFGGGWTKDKILAIMKDSSNGTYAVLGLIILFALKISILSHFSVEICGMAFLFAHVMSRINSVIMVRNLEYVTPQKSKSKDILTKISLGSVFFAVITVIPVFVLFYEKPLLILSVLISPFIYFYSKHYFKKKIGGYTGDCLGAMQQVTEVMILVMMLIVMNFTI